jgi:peptidoglycan/xylan/chitin deacetylase (PgdA/CDA1 family)
MTEPTVRRDAETGIDDLLVLCYHGVSDSWPSPSAVRPQRLRAQLRFLRKRGYRSVSLAEALNGERRGRRLVITFDDAYTSILTLAAPVLRELGMTATVFVPTDAAAASATMSWSELRQWVGSEHEPELRCMSWEQVRELAAQGWEIGSHTCSHPHLPELDDRRLESELEASRRACEEEIQAPCGFLAYPFGDYDARVMERAAAAGYAGAVALDEGLLAPLAGRGLFEIPREAVYRATGWPVFAAKTSPVLRMARNSALWAAARR